MFTQRFLARAPKLQPWSCFSESLGVLKGSSGRTDNVQYKQRAVSWVAHLHQPSCCSEHCGIGLLANMLGNCLTIPEKRNNRVLMAGSQRPHAALAAGGMVCCCSLAPLALPAARCLDGQSRTPSVSGSKKTDIGHSVWNVYNSLLSFVLLQKLHH